jgi:hypothetical protein
MRGDGETSHYHFAIWGRLSRSGRVSVDAMACAAAFSMPFNEIAPACDDPKTPKFESAGPALGSVIDQVHALDQVILRDSCVFAIGGRPSKDRELP